jgi:hypothetical protein
MLNFLSYLFRKRADLLLSLLAGFHLCALDFRSVVVMDPIKQGHIFLVFGCLGFLELQVDFDHLPLDLFVFGSFRERKFISRSRRRMAEV